MGRLKQLPNRLTSLPPRIASPSHQSEADRNRYRRATQPWRKWYSTKAWQSLSWKVRLEAHFTCAQCGRVEGRKGQTVADHKIPHKGDEALFWDENNLQCLCKLCHDKVKQAEERAAGW
ncbi:HNH endonuclease [Defluviimonas aestuarii]|uniref:HNH endonuclease n=1 Tax=Albidovulum aestuarii TaxID=1130726 RepID=UPI002499E68C|nr:HNH endonuclease [Defluviimonas aestuarii]MDI3335877.1 HNH endonuclease [Defluviimonas aestuarii]